MTPFEQLQSRRGSLLRLRTELFWYDGRGHDKNPGRICLLLDATSAGSVELLDASAAFAASANLAATFAVHILVEGRPQWIWISEQDIEVIDESR